jgi:two-component system, NarL family, sensor histidine kinase ComP
VIVVNLIGKLSRPNKYIYISALSVLVLCLNLWCGYITIHYTYIGMDITSHDGAWTIINIDPRGEGENLGLHLGDQIKKVDELPPALHQTVWKWGQVEQANTILVQHGGQDIKYKVHNNNNPIHLFLSLILLGDFCLFIAGILRFKFFQSKSAAKLAYVFGIIGLILISMRASSLDDTLAKFIVACSVSYLPIILAHFIFVFFHENAGYYYKTRLFNIFYLAIGFLSLLRVRYFLAFQNSNDIKIDSFIILLSFITGLLINLIILILFFLRIKRSKDQKLINIIRIIWFTLALSFTPLIFLSVIPLLLRGQAWIDFYYTSMLVFLFPFSFLYLIFAHQLFDINRIIYRSIFFLVAAVAQTIISMIVLLFIEKDKLSLIQLLLFFGIQFFVFVFTLYFKFRFRERLEYLFFPNKHDLEIKLREIIHNMGGMSSLNEIKKRVLEPIAQALDLKGVLLFIGEEVISHGEINFEEARRSLMEKVHSSCSAIPVGQNNFWLVVTKKKSDIKLSREEHRWLNTVSTHLGVTLENLSLIQKLSYKMEEFFKHIPEEGLNELIWLRKTIFQVQERERERIASDLHDTIMQDIYFIKQKLSILSGTQNKEEQDEMLTDVAEHLEVVNFNLRDTCFNIYPYLLNDVGFSKAIQSLINSNRIDTHYQINISVSKEIENLDIEIKRHFFRITQELLNNAKKYSFATEVFLSFHMNDGKCVLDYRDNGKGFCIEVHSEDEHSEIFSGSGLMQIKNRVYSMHGKFIINSRPNYGVKMSILIPMNEAVAI